jgi:hypothetical protein
MNVENLVITGDWHSGGKFSLFPEEFTLDEGTVVKPSPLQQKILSHYKTFENWIDTETGGNYSLIDMGDPIEGNRFHRVDIVSGNLIDQGALFVDLIKPLRDKAQKFWMLRGTEAHGGSAGQGEESLARRLKAIPDDCGRYARYHLRMRWPNGALIDFMHHGRISMSSNKPNLLWNEWVNNVVERKLNGLEPPDMVVRGHAHDPKYVGLGTPLTETVSVGTPAMKLLDGHARKVVSARNCVPRIGIALLQLDQGRVKVKFHFLAIEVTKEEAL